MLAANITSNTDYGSGELSALLLSDFQQRLAENVLHPMRYIISALAVPLALCNVIIFSQRSMRSASGIYVISFNCGQLIFVLTRIVKDVWADSVDQEITEFYWCLYSMYVSVYVGLLVAQRASHVVLCLSSIERLYAVIRPLHIKNFPLSKRPRLCVIAVYFITAVWHVYHLAGSRLLMVPIPPTGKPFCVSVKTELYLKYPHVNEAFGSAARIVLGFIPLSLQLLLNILTVWALRRHNTANKHVTSSANENAKRQQERQLTTTLLVASSSFVILTLPSLFHSAFSVAFPEFFIKGKYENLFLVIGSVTYNLSILACGIDFFSYLGLSSKYRNTLRKLTVCKDLKRENSPEDLDDKSHTEAISMTSVNNIS